MKKGDKLVQKNLAKSLELIAENGPDAFYKGAIADQIAEEMKKNGGLITKADLAEYAQRAERYHSSNNSYSGYTLPSKVSPREGGATRYDLSYKGDGSTFTITASP